MAATACTAAVNRSAPPAAAAIDAWVARCQRCLGEAELRPAAETSDQLEFLRRVVAADTLMTGRPPAAGNRVDLLLDGPATHRAQLEAIAHARDHVHLITYILTDETLAHEYLRVLADRVRAGVKVRLMFDAVGSNKLGPQYRQALEQAGIEVREAGPLNPLNDKGRDWHTTRRHHRKLLVVDGRVAFTGGANITDDYQAASVSSGGGTGAGSGPGGGGSKGKAPGKGGWRDTNVRIEGPAVAEFQRLFFQSWNDDGSNVPKEARYWPPLPRRGHDFVRAVTEDGNDITGFALEPIADIISHSRKKPQNAIYASYVAAMAAARRRIWITQAYFIPNDDFVKVLTDAARRGVDVRVLVPGTSDIKAMVQASRFHYAPLLEAGARVYEFKGPMLHAKTAVIDGVWSTVGSSNLDYRSFIHNDEANAIILGRAFGAQMEKMYLDDLAHAAEIRREDWEHRAWSDRLKQRAAEMLKYWI